MGRWLVDGEDISQMAYNVSVRGGTWRVPAKRGDNSQTQNQNGATFVPGKPYEEGKCSFKMWAVGALPDGTVPLSSARQCRENVEKLISLFSKDTGLVELVRMEAGFGLRNLFPNPSFETPGPETILYENLIVNPDRKVLVDTAWLTNLVRNPAIAAKGSFVDIAENLVFDPRTVGTRPSLYGALGINYLSPQSGEGQTVGSTTGLTTWAMSGTTQSWQASNGEGTRAWQITASATLATQTVFAYRSALTYCPDNPYFRFIVRRAGTTTDTQSISWRWIWVDDSNAVISNGAWNLVSLPASGNWTKVFTPIGAKPAGAVTARIQFRNEQAWAATRGILLDGLVVGVMNATGKTPPSLSCTDSWTVGSETTTAWWDGCNRDNRWIIPSTPVWYGAAYMALTESSGVTFAAYGDTVDLPATQLFRLPVATPSAGHWYGIAARWKALTGITWTARLRSSTDGGATWTTIATLGGTGTGTANVQKIDGSLTTTYGTADPGWTPAAMTGTEQLVIEVEVPAQNHGRALLHLDELAVVTFPSLLQGDTGSSSNTQYRWDGAQYNSKSIRLARTAGGLTTWGQAGYGTIDVNSNNSRYDAVNIWSPIKGAPGGVSTEDLPIADPRQGIFASARVATTPWSYVTNVSAQLVVDVYDAADTVVDTITGPVQTAIRLTAAKEEFTLLTARKGALPATADHCRARIVISNPQGGEEAYVSQIQVLDHNQDPGGLIMGGLNGAVWNGTPNQSTSSQTKPLPANWTPRRGVITNSAGYLIGNGVDSDVSMSTPVTLPAGDVHCGLWFTGSSYNVDGWMDFYNAGTLVASAKLTNGVYGQTVVTLPTAVTEVWLRFNHLDGVMTGSDWIQLTNSYVIPAAGSGLPRLPFNVLGDGIVDLGSVFWSENPPGDLYSIGGLETTIVDGDTGVRVNTLAYSTESATTPTPGAWLPVYVRVSVPPGATCTVEVQWLTFGGHPISTTMVGAATSDRELRGMIEIPALTGLASACLKVTTSIPGSVILAAFLGEPGPGIGNVFPGLDLFPSSGTFPASGEPPELSGDPTIWLGIVGNGFDSQNLPTKWQGTPGQTVTQAYTNQPAHTSGGYQTNNDLNPPGSKGYRWSIRPSTTITTLVTDAVLTPAGLVSGEISYARTGGTLTVDVMGGNTAADPSPVLLHSATLTDPAGTYTWLGVANPRTHTWLRVSYTGTRDTGKPEVALDNLLILSHSSGIGGDYPGYFDGGSGVSQWEGPINDSTSIYYGGARRCYAECVSEVAADTMAGGTRAELEFEMNIPGVFWEDMFESAHLGIVQGTSGILSLDEFLHMTAPLEDSHITVKLLSGTASTGFQVTDMAGGSWVKVSYPFTAGDVIDIYCGNQEILKNGMSIDGLTGGYWAKSGNARFLAINSPKWDESPQLRVSSPSMTGNFQVTVVGKRKFKIA